MKGEENIEIDCSLVRVSQVTSIKTLLSTVFPKIVSLTRELITNPKNREVKKTRNEVQPGRLFLQDLHV
jgi:uncharacterized membrane protein YagU involved in acid resistance